MEANSIKLKNRLCVPHFFITLHYDKGDIFSRWLLLGYGALPKADKRCCGHNRRLCQWRSRKPLVRTGVYRHHGVCRVRKGGLQSRDYIARKDCRAILPLYRPAVAKPTGRRHRNSLSHRHILY